MIALTFDTDWVNPEILEPLVKILIENKLKATFFVTGNYPILKNPLFEINPHINFNGCYDNYKKEFLKIKKLAPKSIGVRNHSLYFHERLRPVLLNLKVKYTSNSLIPLTELKKPIHFGKNLFDIPIYFMDYWYLETFEKKAKFDLKNLNLNQPGLKVFDFHPVHLALNTPNLKYYSAHRFLDNPKKLIASSYKGNGINTIFEKLINYIVSNKIKTYQLKEIYIKFR